MYAWMAKATWFKLVIVANFNKHLLPRQRPFNDLFVVARDLPLSLA